MRATGPGTDRRRRLMAKETKRESLVEVVAREGRVVRHCVGLIDRGLWRCNAALEALQPKQPGRITLLKTVEKSRGKIVLNEVRWRVVQWRIRRGYSDGSVEWQAVLLPTRGAAKRTLSKFGFHDTEPEVRKALLAAVALIEWRTRVLKTVTNFVTGMESHNRFGIWQAVKQINKAVAAADAGNRKRAKIKAAAQQIARAREGRAS